jgi:hypothetical protein
VLAPITILPNENLLQVNLHLPTYSTSERFLVDTKVCMLMQYINLRYTDVKVRVYEDLYHLITGMEILFSTIEDAIEFRLSTNLFDIL